MKKLLLFALLIMAANIFAHTQFSIVPLTKHFEDTDDGRASWVSHETEIAKPYYYSVYLAGNDVTTETTPQRVRRNSGLTSLKQTVPNFPYSPSNDK